MTKFMNRFGKNESGATAIEYGVIAALIAVVIIGAVTAVSDQLRPPHTPNPTAESSSR